MKFQLPTFGQAVYRLRRLRRLILCATLLPVFALALMQTISWVWLDVPPTGVIRFAIGALALICVHAVIFPNAHTETKSISLVLMLAVILGSLLGGTLLVWLAVGVVGSMIAILFQDWLAGWELRSLSTAPEFKASVRTKVSQEVAMRAFALHPKKEDQRYSCGPADEDGIFSVLLKQPEHGLLEGFSNEQADTSDSTDPIEQSGPLQFALVVRKTDDVQRTVMLQKGPDGQTLKTGEILHQFEARRKGCLVTETDRPFGFGQAMATSMWLTDYQKDTLIWVRDTLEGRSSLTNRASHQHGILTMIGQYYMRRQSHAPAGEESV